MNKENLFRAALYVAMVGCIAWLAGFIMLRAQAAGALYQFPPASQPACAATLDATNKLLTTNCSVNGVPMPALSYNPRVLEGNNGGVFTITYGGITIKYTHNLPADPLTYTVGSTTLGGAAIVQCGLAPSPACPTIPW